MAHIFLILLISFILTSCPDENFKLIDLIGKDRHPPVLLGLKLEENRTITLHFDEKVSVVECTVDDADIRGITDEVEDVVMTMPERLDHNERKRLFITVEDESGNTSRHVRTITGENLNQADLIITEVSSAGSEENPDRIELSVTRKGTLGGIYVSSGDKELGGYGYYLPDEDVRSGDIIVIYWDRPRDGDMRVDRGSQKTLYYNAESPKTLTSTNGAIILYSSVTGEGKIEDAVVWRKSDAENSNGFGSENTKLTYESLVSKGEWTGDALYSDNVTSTRVFARTYPYEDTNTRDDFHITDTKGETFGERNTNKIYYKK